MPLNAIIVDDEQLARDELAYLLKNVDDVRVLAQGKNGVEAINLIREHAPDLVFLDVQMPGLDGLAVTRAWRRRGGSAATLPFVAMTGSTEPEDVAACRAAGMGPILTKPFPLSDLQRALLEAIDSGAAAAPRRG